MLVRNHGDFYSHDLLGEVGESVREKVADKTLQELAVGSARWCHILSVDWTRQLLCTNKPEHACKKHRLVLEACLVVRVGKHEKDVL